MELAHRWIDRNLTRKELIIAILIFSLLIGTFSHYMYTVFGKVEKSMLDRTLMNINSAIKIQSALALSKKDNQFFDRILTMSPMNLMTNEILMGDMPLNNHISTISSMVNPPVNYGGEVIDDSDYNLEGGKWYFDVDDKFIFYKINNSEFFTSTIDGPARIRYKVKIVFIDNNIDSVFDPLIDEFKNIGLKSIDDYEWAF